MIKADTGSTIAEPAEVEEQRIEVVSGGAGTGEPIVVKMPVSVRSVTLTVIAVLGTIFVLRYAQDVFVPIVLSVLIAYALDPIVGLLTRVRLPRTLASSVVMLTLVAGMIWATYSLRQQALNVINTLPEAAQKLRQKVREINLGSDNDQSAISKIKEAASELEKTAAEAAGPRESPRGITKVRIADPAFNANDYIWYGSMGILGFLGQLIMILFLVFFMLVSGDLFKRKVVRLGGKRLSEKRLTVETLNEITAQIESFLLIQVCTSAMVGIATGFALWWLGVAQPAIWGVAAGLFNTIPYFGAIIVAAGLALVGFLQFGTIAMAVKIAFVSIVITSLEGFLLTPMWMGRAARINGVAMFLSILFWSWLWGVIGMIVAVPITMVIKCVCDRVEGLQPVGELLGEAKVTRLAD